MLISPVCQEKEMMAPFLEKKLAELHAENKPLDRLLKKLIQNLCIQEVGLSLLAFSLF